MSTWWCSCFHAPEQHKTGCTVKGCDCRGCTKCGYPRSAHEPVGKCPDPDSVKHLKTTYKLYKKSAELLRKKADIDDELARLVAVRMAELGEKVDV